jgi:uncharacterized tellurite resistance protein B-like protein
VRFSPTLAIEYRHGLSGGAPHQNLVTAFGANEQIVQQAPHQVAAQNDSVFALAVLLIDVARSNAERVEDREHCVIERVLAARFDVEHNEVTRLMTAAEAGAIQSTDLFHFTQIVVKNFSEEERIGVVEMLWEVAYSDGVLTGDEDTLIRQVAGLIDVPDRERGEAKLHVVKRLKGS